MIYRAADYLDRIVAELIGESGQLRADIAAYEAAHLRERRAYRLTAALLLAAIVVGAVLLATTRASLGGTRDTLDYVRSCTTPAGDCYAAARVGTVEFREQLLASVAIVADCALSSAGDDRAYRVCVRTRTGIDAAAAVGTRPARTATPK